MTVSDPRVVDIVSLDPLTDTVILSMVEERPWGDRGELLPDLEAKLSTYVEYVESGQLTRDYPPFAGKRVSFRLHYIHDIGPREREYIRVVCRQHLDPAGIGWDDSRIGLGAELDQ